MRRFSTDCRITCLFCTCRSGPGHNSRSVSSLAFGAVNARALIFIARCSAGDSYGNGSNAWLSRPDRSSRPAAPEEVGRVSAFNSIREVSAFNSIRDVSAYNSIM